MSFFLSFLLELYSIPSLYPTAIYLFVRLSSIFITAWIVDCWWIICWLIKYQNASIFSHRSSIWQTSRATFAAWKHRVSARKRRAIDRLAMNVTILKEVLVCKCFIFRDGVSVVLVRLSVGRLCKCSS